MYGNYYTMPNSQMNLDRINTQINELEKLKSQITNPATNQPTNLTQNFQFTPTNNIGIKYANTIDDVVREPIFVETPFFSKDMSVMWLKNPKNEIKTYELQEIVPKDEKDIRIEYLTSRLEQLEREMRHESNAVIDEPITESNESKESSVVPTVSKSKTKSTKSWGNIETNDE